MYIVTVRTCHTCTCTLSQYVLVIHVHVHCHSTYLSLIGFYLFRELPELEYPVFDAGVLRSPVAPKVEEGKVVINNLTHNAMKTRLVYSTCNCFSV